MTNIINKSFLPFIIILFGSVLRLWNINFDDLWFDEIISFWLSDPSRNFIESLTLHYETDVAPFTYHLILKFFFSLFGYKTEIARIISGVFGCLSILSLAYLVKILGCSRAYNFCLYLAGFNIFLISYSQEVRFYSILFFFTTLSIIYFIKSLKKEKGKNLFFFSFYSIFTIIIHPFTFFLVLSYSIYLILIFLKKKILFKRLNFWICFVFLLIFGLYFLHFLYLGSERTYDLANFWIPQISYKFFTNFFFSSYFGSRIMGIFFLISLIFLVIKNFTLFYNLKKIAIFLILIISTYFLAAIFSFLVQNIMLPRYFLFLLAPIIILISVLTYSLNNKRLKRFIIVFLVLITFLNHFSEQTFNQFYKYRSPTKPEYTTVLNYINNSNYNYFSIKLNPETNNNKNNISAIVDYVNLINKKMDFNNVFINSDSINFVDFYWYICPLDFQKKCFSDIELESLNVTKDVYFNRINIKLIKN